jgi:hypothetical protein
VLSPEPFKFPNVVVNGKMSTDTLMVEGVMPTLAIVNLEIYLLKILSH